MRNTRSHSLSVSISLVNHDHHESFIVSCECAQLFRVLYLFAVRHTEMPAFGIEHGPERKSNAVK